MTLNTEFLFDKNPAAVGGYAIERSLRFNSADSAYLNRTPSSAGNTQTWTWSGWVKYTIGSGDQGLFAGDSASSRTQFRFKSNQLDFVVEGVTHRRTSAIFRDPSAWYHIVWAFDSTQSTASDRSRLYINGVEVTNFSTDNAITQNATTGVNSANPQAIGATSTVPNDLFDGYMADVHLIDGQQLAATDFGAFDATTGAWNPIAYTGSYGTNGFKLDFSDNSSASALGTDSSGNSNNWTVNNIAVGAIYTWSDGWDSNTVNPTKAFDGTDNIARAFGTANAVWTAPVSLAFTTLQLEAGHDGGTIKINGVNVTSQFSAQPTSPITVTGVTSPLTSIELDATSGLGNPRVARVIIDGNILIDGYDYPSIDNDSLFDSPTNGTQTDTGAGGEVSGNYATLNPLATNNGTPANGNLEITPSSGVFSHSPTTVAFSSADSNGFYFEVTQAAYAQYSGVGLYDADKATGNLSNAHTLGSSGGNSDGLAYRNDGAFRRYGTESGAGTYSTWTSTSDVIQVAVKDNKVWLGKNNTWQSGDPGAGTSPSYTFSSTRNIVFVASPYTTSATLVINAGQRAFAYTAPSGYKALCTANLDTPLIEDPSTVMDVALYTGNSSTQTISGLGFSPDLVWIKDRTASGGHWFSDVIRGSTALLRSDSTASENTVSTSVTGFTSDGFTLGPAGGLNTSGNAHVAWTWDAGSSTVSNTDGSITSQVRAQPSAGFSAVTYTGNGTSGATVGHGLNAALSMIIVKSRSNTMDWCVYHSSLANTQFLKLNTTGTAQSFNAWNSTSPTSTVFSIGNIGETNTNTYTYVAYCFAPVDGYSAFGSYTGNGSSTNFVHLGFRPRFVMVKRTDSANGWFISDSARGSYNVLSANLRADSSSSESGIGTIPQDFVSNGFVLKDNSGVQNTLNGTYIYAAFAENPFKYARAR